MKLHIHNLKLPEPCLERPSPWDLRFQHMNKNLLSPNKIMEKKSQMMRDQSGDIRQTP